MTNVPATYNNLQQTMSITTHSFDRKKILSQALQESQKSLPEHLQAHHIMSIIRHGKTLLKENESMAKIDPKLIKDPPKGSNTPLDPTEYERGTSTLYQQALTIKKQGFKKVKIYRAGDTVRNDESTKLMKQYLSELGVQVDYYTDCISELSARKKRELSTINELLEKGHITQEQFDTLNFGQKHVIGNAKIIDLPKIAGKKLYEESYTQTINNAVTGIKKIQHIIAKEPSDPDTLHLVVAYRTTLQAADIQQSKIREKQGVDLHYSGPFAEMKHYPLTHNGNFQLRESEKAGKHLINIPLDQYHDAIQKLSNILPDISLNQGFKKNNDTLNQYLYYLEGFIQERLNGNHTNIINYYLSQYPMIGEKILNHLIELLDDNIHKEKSHQAIKNFLQQGFHSLSPNHQTKILDIIYNHNPLGDLWKISFVEVRKSNQNALRSHLKNNESFNALYDKLSGYKERQKEKIDSVVGSVSFDEIYIQQDLFNNKNGSTTTLENTLKNCIDSHENLFIESAPGSGKSFAMEYLYRSLIDLNKLSHYSSRDKNIHKIDLGSTSVDQIKKYINTYNNESESVILLDGWDECNNQVRNIISHHIIENTPLNQKNTIIIAGRYIDLGDKNIATYSINQENNLHQLIDTYTKQLPQRKRNRFLSLMSEVGKTNRGCTPIIAAMASTLTENSLIRRKLSQGSVTVSDIYEQFVYEYSLREEDKQYEYSENEEMYFDPQYDDIKKIILETIMEKHIYRRDGLRLPPSYKYKVPQQQHIIGEHAHKKCTGSDEELISFMNQLIYNIQKHYMTKEGKEVNPQDYHLTKTVDMGPNDTVDVLDVESFGYLLDHMSRTGLLEKHGESGYTFNLDHIHKSFYDYFGYRITSKLTLPEYIQNIDRIIHTQNYSIEMLNDADYRNNKFDDIYYMRSQKDFMDSLPQHLQGDIRAFPNDENSEKSEEQLLREANKYACEFYRKNSRALKNIHEYITFRFFENKRELPIVMKHLAQYRGEIGWENFRGSCVSAASEVIGPGGLSYHFFSEYDHIDHHKQKIQKAKIEALSSIIDNGREDVFDSTFKDIDTIPEYIKDHIKNPGNDTIPTSILTHSINQMKSAINGGKYSNIDNVKKELITIYLDTTESRDLHKHHNIPFSPVDYLSEILDNMKQYSSPYMLFDEYMKDFGMLYRLSNDEKFHTELNTIKKKIMSSSRGEPPTGNLIKDITDLTTKYGFPPKSWSKNDNLNGSEKYTILDISKKSFLFDAFFGFA